MKICLAVSVEYRRVTDGRTDRQTCDGIVHPMHKIAKVQPPEYGAPTLQTTYKQTNCNNKAYKRSAEKIKIK